MTDVHDSPEADDEYARFEILAQKVVNTPKPKPQAPETQSAEQPPRAGAVGESSDDDSERERT